jgi:hypothetical protein
MIRLLTRVALLAAVLAAVPVLATTTWSAVTTPGYVRGAKGVNPTATGTDPAPVTSTATSDGMELAGVTALTVQVETTTGGNMTASSTFTAYWWNPKDGTWAPISSLNLTTAAVPRQAWAVTPPADYGRIAWEPTSVGTTTILYVFGAKRYPTNR